MPGIPDSEAQKIMGSRLHVVRDALGLTQEDMAETMGVVVTTLSGWETGRNQIDIVKLAKAATRYGFTTDWVARGDMSGLRKDLADKIESMAKTEPPPRRGRPRASNAARSKAAVRPMTENPAGDGCDVVNLKPRRVLA